MRANRALYLIMMATLLLCDSAVAAETRTEIRFSPLPMVEERTLRSQFLPMLEYLTQHTGIRFRWTYIPEYQEVLNAQKRGEVDLAFLGPLPYVKLVQSNSDFAPIVHFRERDGSHGYNCALVAFSADQISQSADVIGKRIGLTQPESTCGYFAVSVMLARAGRSIDDPGNRYEYAGGHDKAIIGVVKGLYDVAGAKSAIAQKYAHLGLRVIDQAGRYPGFALVANTNTLTPKQREAIRNALLNAGPEERANWGEPMRNGAIPASDKDYEPLRLDLQKLDRQLEENR